MILSKAADLIWGDVDLFIFHAESVGPAFDGEGAGVSGTRVPGDGAALGAGRVAHFEVEDVGGEETGGVESGAEEEEAPDTMSNILSGVAFAAALVVLVVQLMTIGTWADEESPVEGPGWSAALLGE